MIIPDNEYFMSQKHYVEGLLNNIVNFKTEVYWVSSNISGVGNRDSYQIMPHLSENENKIEFWNWHLSYNRQYFETPLEAAVEFANKYKEWVSF